jgi:hypothetical protein
MRIASISEVQTSSMEIAIETAGGSVVVAVMMSLRFDQ